MSRRSVSFLVVLVGGILALLQVPAYGGWETLFQEDFDTDPGWTTDQSSNFHWDPTTGSYFLRESNQPETYSPNRYTYTQVPSLSRAWRLQWDQQMLRSDWSAGIDFGLFDSHMSYLPSSTGNAAGLSVEYTHPDQGQGFTVFAHQDPASKVSNNYTPFALDQWYRNVLEYDPGTSTAKFTVFERGQTTPFAQNTVTGVPSLVDDLTRLGATRYPLTLGGIDPYGIAEARVDNIVLSQASAQPQIFGLFVGVNDNGVNGSIDAQKVYDAVSTNLRGFREGIVLTDTLVWGENTGVTKSEIQAAINTLETKMSPGDTFIFFSSSHGYSYSSGTETTNNNPGDEVLSTTMSASDELTDDALTSYLAGMDNIHKWVMLNACHSGGFWGNNNPLDDGDLEKLSDIAFFAAAGENSSAYSWKVGDEVGESYFAQRIEDAFSLRETGFWQADDDHNWVVTYEELQDWIEDDWWLWANLQTPTFAYENAQGDLVSFTPDMWDPVTFASPNFTGGLGNNQPIPAPGALLLSGIGIGLVGCLRRRGTL